MTTFFAFIASMLSDNHGAGYPGVGSLFSGTGEVNADWYVRWQYFNFPAIQLHRPKHLLPALRSRDAQ